jgi:hypothetical protein
MVDPSGPDELMVRPAFGHQAVIQDDDLVHLVQALQVVGDQQRAPPGRGGQQVGGQRAAVLRVMSGTLGGVAASGGGRRPGAAGTFGLNLAVRGRSTMPHARSADGGLGLTPLR